MSDEPEKVVAPEPEETTPAPEVTPPAVDPKPDNTLEEIKEQIAALTETVNGILNNASTTPDSTPVSKPWTHRW